MPTSSSHPFIPVANTVSVEMIFAAGGQIIENVYHVLGSAPFSLSDIQTLRGVFDTWHNGTQKAHTSSGCVLTRIRSKALDSLGAPIEDYSLPSPRAGTLNGALMAFNLTKAIKLQTGLTGRSYRGRIYWPGVTTDMTGGAGYISAAWQATLAADINTLRTAITAANAAWHMAVVSYRNNKAWRTTGVATVVNTAVCVTNFIDSQRRRLPGRGR